MNGKNEKTKQQLDELITELMKHIEAGVLSQEYFEGVQYVLDKLINFEHEVVYSESEE